jgi:hypothetical protein
MTAREEKIGRNDAMVSPPGKSSKVRPVLDTKIFCLTWKPNQHFNFARLTADEGRLAIVTNVAVRCNGRGWCAGRSTLLADGEAVWS